jgi:regulatory protein
LSCHCRRSRPTSTSDGADPESVARKILLDQLTGQPRTRTELAGKLAKKGVPPEIAERLLARFEEVGLVDDAAFSRAWVQSRSVSRGLARRALAQELRRKGIDEEVARSALTTVGPEQEEEAARALVRRRLRTVTGLDRDRAMRRLTGMLGRKGYSASLAFRVVRQELEAAGHGDVDPDVDRGLEMDDEPAS